MWPVLLWLLVKFNRKFREEHFKEREEAETNAEIEAKKLQDADTAAAREHESLLRDRVIAMEAALAAEADARAKLEGRITVEYAEVQAQLKLKMDRPRASPQVGFLQEGRDRKSPAPEASRRPSHQDENPHQFRLAKLRRSSSREEALARKKSVSATSRPERLARACVKMPGQAVRVIQSAGVDILHSCSAVLATREKIDSPTPQPHDEKGWKSGRLRNAIRGGCLSSAAAAMEAHGATEGGARKVEELEVMINELQAQLSAKEKSPATHMRQPASLGCAGAPQEVEGQSVAPPKARPPAVRKEALQQSLDLPKPRDLPRPACNAMAGSLSREPEPARSLAAACSQDDEQGSQHQLVPLVGRAQTLKAHHREASPAGSQRRFYL